MVEKAFDGARRSGGTVSLEDAGRDRGAAADKGEGESAGAVHSRCQLG